MNLNNRNIVNIINTGKASSKFAVNNSSVQFNNKINPDYLKMTNLADFDGLKRNKDDISFGSTHLQNIPNSPALKTVLYFAGLGTLIPHVINMLGKATLSPAVILSVKEDDKCSEVEKKKSKENKKYSALLQPIEAAIEFTSYLAINFLVNDLIIKNQAKLSSFYKTPANLDKLKFLTFTTVTMVAIPFISKFTSWITPKAVPVIDNSCNHTAKKICKFIKNLKENNSDKKTGKQ